MKVIKGVDALMSRSKHTIPHAQSSPCVNLSIGARARQVQDGTGRGGANDRKQEDRERHNRVWGCGETPETSVTFLSVRSYVSVDTEHTRTLFRPGSERLQLSFPPFLVFFCRVLHLFCSQAKFVLPRKKKKPYFYYFLAPIHCHGCLILTMKWMLKHLYSHSLCYSTAVTFTIPFC